MQKAIKDLEPGDRVLTIDGPVATITKVERCYILEGDPPPYEVTWEIDGKEGHRLGSGEVKVNLAD